MVLTTKVQGSSTLKSVCKDYQQIEKKHKRYSVKTLLRGNSFNYPSENTARAHPLTVISKVIQAA